MSELVNKSTRSEERGSGLFSTLQPALQSHVFLPSFILILCHSSSLYPFSKFLNTYYVLEIDLGVVKKHDKLVKACAFLKFKY